MLIEDTTAPRKQRHTARRGRLDPLHESFIEQAVLGIGIHNPILRATRGTTRNIARRVKNRTTSDPRS